MTPELDLRHSSNIRDPYSLYRWLREHDPIHWSDSLRGWLISRDHDVRHVFQNPEIFASDRRGKIRDGAFSNRSAAADVWEVMGKQVAYRDPPDHTRLRRLLNKAFATREVESMRPRIEELVNHLLDEVEAKGELEFVKDFAFPLPAHIISRMIGASTLRFRFRTTSTSSSCGPTTSAPTSAALRKSPTTSTAPSAVSMAWGSISAPSCENERPTRKTIS